MPPPVTTAELNDHVAAAAYLMKHACTTAVVIADPRTGEPGRHPHRDRHQLCGRKRKNLNEIRICDLTGIRTRSLPT